MIAARSERSFRLSSARAGDADVVGPPPFARTIVVDASDVDLSRVPDQFLDTARAMKVLFNHQSIGANLLDGLASLAREDPTRYALARAHRPALSWYAEPSTGLGDFTEGRNAKPLTKLAGFERLIRASGYGSGVEVAVMKFCFVDMGRIGPQDLWDRYRTTMQQLQRDYPRVTFVWVTVPLTSGDNGRQTAINDLMRRYVASGGGVLFDIASLESVSPGGTTSPGRHGYPRLDPAYDSGDGGHLSHEGRVRLASAWWQMMARIAGWEPASEPAAG